MKEPFTLKKGESEGAVVMAAEEVIRRVRDVTAAGAATTMSKEMISGRLGCNGGSWKWHLEMIMTNSILTCTNHFRR